MIGVESLGDFRTNLPHPNEFRGAVPPTPPTRNATGDEQPEPSEATEAEIFRAFGQVTIEDLRGLDETVKKYGIGEGEIPPTSPLKAREFMRRAREVGLIKEHPVMVIIRYLRARFAK